MTTTIEDQDSIIEVPLVNAAGAGKTFKTRFGVIAFDGDGAGKAKVRVGDLPLLNQLNWLTNETKEEYQVGVVVQTAAVEGDVHAMSVQYEAMERANTQLAKKNAQLEADMEQLKAKADEYVKTMSERAAAEIEGLKASLGEQNQALSAQLTERDAHIVELEKQLADATKGTKKGK